MRAVITALLEKQQWESCRDAANAALATNPPDDDQAFLWLALCRCQFKLEEYHQALQAGIVAGFLARRVGDWDRLGEAIYRTGVCYFYSAMYQQAIDHLQEFAAHERHYQTAHGFKGEVLFTLGFANQMLGQYRPAHRLYAEAVRWAEVEGREQRMAYYCCNLIWILLELGETEQASQVLERLKQYIAQHPDDSLTASHAAHDQAHLLYLQQRLPEAFRQSMAAVRRAGRRHPLVAGQVLMTLHRISRQERMVPEAIHLALAAKRLAARTSDVLLDEQINNSLKEIFALVGTPDMAEALNQAGQFGTAGARVPRMRRQAIGGAP